MTALMRVIIIAYVQGTTEAEGVSTVSDACPPLPLRHLPPNYSASKAAKY